MTTLEKPALQSLLRRLYDEAKDNDARVMPPVRAAMAQQGGVFDDHKVAPMLADAFMAVAPEVGRLLYMLTRARRPTLAVEFGTSFGLSTLHIAAALRDNGAGRLVTSELEPAKVARAGAHVREAGLDDLVEIRKGDALITLADLRGIDLLLLDGWKGLYLPLLKKLEPALSPGCLIIADDIRLMPELLAPYVAHVRDPQNGYTSCELPIDDGLELSLR